jgi:hypothetical protein
MLVARNTVRIASWHIGGPMSPLAIKQRIWHASPDILGAYGGHGVISSLGNRLRTEGYTFVRVGLDADGSTDYLFAEREDLTCKRHVSANLDHGENQYWRYANYTHQHRTGGWSTAMLAWHWNKYLASWSWQDLL